MRERIRRACEVCVFEDQWMAQINTSFSTFINVQYYQSGSWGKVLLFKDDLATSPTSIISVCSATIPSTEDASNKGETCENRELEFINILTTLAAREKEERKASWEHFMVYSSWEVDLTFSLFFKLYRKRYVYHHHYWVWGSVLAWPSVRSILYIK